MSTKSKLAKMMTYNVAMLAAGALVLAVSTASLADDSTDAASQDVTRSSRTLQVGKAARDQRATAAETLDSYDELEIAGERRRRSGDKPGSPAGSAKFSTTQTASQSTGNDFWIYDVDIELFYDDDGDGYYHGIDLLFDADTFYSAADVYAVVYLSLDGGPWNEYAVSDDFTIFGASSGDEYVLVTELMSGYPTGDYDLLIELFDAFDGSYLAGLGPEDTSVLGYLPLEDFNRDAPVVERQVTITHGGGGAFGLHLLLLLLTAGLARRR